MTSLSRKFGACPTYFRCKKEKKVMYCFAAESRACRMNWPLEPHKCIRTQAGYKIYTVPWRARELNVANSDG